MRLTRRSFLFAPAAMGASRAIRRELVRKSPRKGVAVRVIATYTRPRGLELLSIEGHESRSDLLDVVFCRRSPDNGRTWSEPETRATQERREGGTLRRFYHPGWVDPATGRYIEFWIQGLLPNDDPLDGMRRYQLFYRYSEDGGRSWSAVEPVVHEGAEFSAEHPLPGVYIGKNGFMLGDATCQPIRVGEEILLPIVIAPLAPDGSLYNPTGAYTYHDAYVLLGRWRGRRLRWRMSEPIKGDPARTTRGMDEPTLGRLADGRILCVLRGSNDLRPELPGYKWVSFSEDGGRRWSRPEPWTYSNGEPFYSPASCSQLLEHSSGRLFWLGNIIPENPRGNLPRYPFVIGEVDRKTGLLIRTSIRTVDDRGPGEDASLQLSNFYAREDRETGEIALHMSRFFVTAEGFAADAYLYRIPV